jgi:hypothetical protein
MNIAVGITGSKHLAETDGTDISVGWVGPDPAAQAEALVDHISANGRDREYHQRRPLPAHVREIMADRTQWTGSASDLLQWPKSPRALAGRLRWAQTFLRTLANEIVFHREGRFGTRTSG